MYMCYLLAFVISVIIVPVAMVSTLIWNKICDMTRSCRWWLLAIPAILMLAFYARRYICERNDRIDREKAEMLERYYELTN